MLRLFWRNRSNLFASPYLPNRPALPIGSAKRSLKSVQSSLGIPACPPAGRAGAGRERKVVLERSPKKEKAQGFGVLAEESS